MTGGEWSEAERLFAVAAGLPASERTAWLARSGAPPGVRDLVARMLSAHDAEPAFLEPPTHVAGVLARAVAPLQDPWPVPVGGTIAGWDVLERIGAGGMGVVFLVRKQGLANRGALKLIQQGIDSAALSQRFVRERHILSRLEHPNIARLLDGGASERGQPYFVMEYVDGLPITTFCDRARSGVRARLALFLQVCDAVAYAHRHLVVHRDVKPSNILVTADGTVKLLDFGIARLLADDVDPSATLTQGPMFTPDYAAPEQVQGETVTTAADVWALGAVLYELLAGAKPFARRTGGIPGLVTAILTEEPTPPSRVRAAAARSTLARDLDNIVLKAMQKEPERRYASVTELAADIRRCLDGLPVSATAPSLVYRASKFVRRHKAATAVGILAAALGSVATWQGIVATRERARAQARFDQVRKLANAVIFTYQDGVRNLAGATAVREQMVSDAAAYLDTLAAEATGEPELRVELARAYDRLGDVKASFSTASVRNGEAARDFYNRAMALKTGLLAREPGSPVYAAEIAITHDKLGHVAFGMGHRDEALDRYRRARDLREALVAGGHSDPQLRLLLARNYRDLAVRGRTPANVEEGLALCQRALTLSEALVREEPDSEAYLENHGDVLEGIAAILETSTERRRDAVAAYERLIEIRRGHAERFPLNLVLGQKHGMAFSYLGDTWFELGDLSKAIDAYRRSVAALDPLVRQDPLNEPLAQDTANIRSSLGYSLAALGDTRESVEILRAVLPLVERKSGRDAGDRTAAIRLAMAREGLALATTNVARRPDRPRADRLAALIEARSLYEQALETYERFRRDEGRPLPTINVDLDDAVTDVREALRRNGVAVADLGRVR